MAHSIAGKARISIVWMISVGVLFLVAVFFAFIAQSDLTNERTRVVQAEAAVADMSARLEQQNELRRNVSSALGWFDRTSVDASSDAEAARQALEELKSTFSDLGAAEKDFESSIPKIIAAYSERGRKIAELETRIQGLQGELQAAQKATGDVQVAKDETINGLQQQLSDEQKNAQQRESELEGRLEALRTQLSERDGELRTAREEAGLARRGFEDRQRRDQARISELSRATSFAKSPHADQPDARVLEVSERLQLGWIDVGANQRLARGMRFRVESGTATNRHLKAWADVTDVEANRAEVAFSGVVDRYDPVVPGDVVVNPLYDPVGGRNAVLVGRFSGSYNEQELTTLLDRMGIHVQDEVDLTTHFLIVGSELWNDPDTNEPLEEPIQPSDLPAYKNAESMGVQIIPLQDIREFFRAGAGL